MISKLKKFLSAGNRYYPKPALHEGEEIIREGTVFLEKGLFGGRRGRIILTERHLLWYDTGKVWPLTKISGELSLSDISSVDKGTLLDFIGGGKRLRLRLRNGKSVCLF